MKVYCVKYLDDDQGSGVVQQWFRHWRDANKFCRELDKDDQCQGYEIKPVSVPSENESIVRFLNDWAKFA